VAGTPVRARSEQFRQRAVSRIPGGVNSNVRLSAPPVYFDRGSDARIWDVDGNEYVDYVLGQGPHFLGHANRVVNAAVAEACGRGMLFGAQNSLEVEACELTLDAIGWADMIRLGLTGTECVQAALRAARAATGRTAFVHFEGHYHGWLDNVLVQTTGDRTGVASRGQLDSQLADCHIIGWNDGDALAALLHAHGDTIAAVLMEPMMVNAGGIEPLPGYLQQVRDLCDQYGVVLIFDEVITGFRLGRGGAAEKYGVSPDLATYGKAMAGGWPVAAIAGRRDLMEPFGTGAVNHSGTFNGSVMAAAAIVATQQLLVEDSPYERIQAYGTELMAHLVKIAERHAIPLRVQGVPAAFHVSFGDPAPVHDLRTLNTLDLGRYAAFATRLAEHGLWLAQRGIWYVSAAHGDEELADTLERLESALAERLP
jgi:glutamate-1-semialdehyde 2,1-aminomutase